MIIDVLFIVPHMRERDAESISVISATINLRDSLLFRKFVLRMRGSKRKSVYGQIFEKAAILGPSTMR